MVVVVIEVEVPVEVQVEGGLEIAVAVAAFVIFVEEVGVVEACVEDHSSHP